MLRTFIWLLVSRNNDHSFGLMRQYPVTAAHHLSVGVAFYDGDADGHLRRLYRWNLLQRFSFWDRSQMSLAARESCCRRSA